MEVGARLSIVDDGFVLAAQLDVEFPTGGDDERSGLSTGHDAYTVTPSVAIGKGYDGAYVFGQLGVVLDPANLQTGLYVNDQEYVAYGAKLLVDLTRRVGLQGTFYTAAGGNNVPRSSLDGLGVYFRW